MLAAYDAAADVNVTKLVRKAMMLVRMNLHAEAIATLDKTGAIPTTPCCAWRGSSAPGLRRDGQFRQ